MGDQPREERADEDAAGASSDLRRLFEESSFGSPEAQEAYIQPPPQLVADIIERISAVVDIESYRAGHPIYGQDRQTLSRHVLGETQIHRPLPPRVGVQSDTVLAARRAGLFLAQSREINRAADSIVADSESLLVPGRDLRMMSDGDREESQVLVAQWRELLSACPARAFGMDESARVLTTAAALAETLIANRDEHTALNLIRTAYPHLALLGRSHPVGFDIRRARAEALSELGHYRQAEAALRRLSADEQRVFGSADPRTTMLLLWALVGQDRLREADNGFRSLEDHLSQASGANTLLLKHAQCRHSWLRGRLGLVDESVSDYTRVIVGRTAELGEDHADTLDARHSQQKIQVVAGQGVQALLFLETLSNDRARVQGDRHPDTLETLKHLHLARVQAEPGDDRVVKHAIRELVEIDRIQRERHGRSHPLRQDTAASLRKLLRGEPFSSLLPVSISNEEHGQMVLRPGSSGLSRDTSSTLEQTAR